MAQESAPAQEAQPRVPSTVGGYARAVGPGLVVAMAWLGPGDLVSSSVSGSTYGYALLWSLVLALVARYFIVSTIAKYQLCNSNGDKEILQGFGRVWKPLTMIIGIIAFAVGFQIQLGYVRGAAVSLFHLSGGIGGETWGLFLWGVLAAAFSMIMMSRRQQYTIIEWIARIAAVVIIVGFLIAIVETGVHIAPLLEGLVFSIPPDVGAFGALLVAVATIGAVGGSAANLTYPYFMEDKGWSGTRYRKLQLVDLATGIIALVIINLVLWIVAAELLARGGANISVTDEESLARMFELAIGPLGPTLLWVTLFGATITSFPAFSRAFSRILLSSIHISTSRGERYDTVYDDPAFRVIQFGIMHILVLVIVLPGAPNLIQIVEILGGTLFLIAVLPIIIGIILMTSKRSLMLPGYANKWWEIAILTIIALFSLYAMYGTAQDVIAALSGG